MTMIVVMRTTNLATAKAKLSEVLESVYRTHERVAITRNGETVAVIVSPDDLESLEETLAILAEPEAIANLDEADHDATVGRSFSLEEVRAELARRIAR